MMQSQDLKSTVFCTVEVLDLISISRHCFALALVLECVLFCVLLCGQFSLLLL